MRVVVIVAGGLHLGYLGCYGNDWVPTPALDRLASEGVVFDQHLADLPDAAGAAHAWRTGRYGLPLPEDEPQPGPADEPNLLTLLRDGGVETCLVADPGHGLPGNFHAGWTQVAAGGLSVGSPEELRVALRTALDRWAGPDRGLLWLDVPTLRPPWQVPAKFLRLFFEPDDDTEAEEPLEPLSDLTPGPLDGQDATAFRRLQGTYAGAAAYLDAGLDAVLEELRQQSGFEEALLIVTADHGVALGEHGVVGDFRPWLHDERIHLPLIVRLPGAAEAGRRVPTLTQAVDLMPTLLDAFGLPVPAMVHGRSLLPLARGECEEVRPYACAGLRQGERVEWALRTPAWAFLLPVRQAVEDPPRPAQLYVKPDDRWEVNNLIQHHLELAEHFGQTLRDFARAARQPGPLQAPVLRDIEAELAATEQAGEGEPGEGGSQP